MSLFSRLFGGSGKTPEAEPQAYNGFDIIAEPIREGGKWRVAARIEKDVDGDVKVHQLIRADTIDDELTAIEVSIGKAKQMIDEQGEGLFS
ncbi:MAG: HlyU family transcriptional regulator [Paracoccaceae bacterium]